MSKLLRTGGYDPLEAGYEAPVEPDYEALDAEALSLMLAFDTPAPAAPYRVSGPVFERGKIDFARIRREHPLEDVGARLLSGYKQRGPTSAQAACPVHGDSAEHGNLSLHFGAHPHSGSWICSSCRAHGDVLDLVMAAMGLSTHREALDFLDGGRPLSDAQRQALEHRAEENTKRASKIPALNLDLTVFAREAYNHLRGQPGLAREYLSRRGLERAIGRYGLGFVPKGFPADLLPLTWDFEKDETRPAFGFFERIIIPYRQPGNVVPVVNARRMTDAKPKYLKPSAGGVSGNSNARPYLIELAAANDDVICITEGEFDCMSLGLAAGDLLSEIAIPGVNCFKERDAEMLEGRRVILITDNDDAGRRAQGPIRELLEAYAANVTLHQTPLKYKDVNDLLVGEGVNGVREWIEQALKGGFRLLTWSAPSFWTLTHRA